MRLPSHPSTIYRGKGGGGGALGFPLGGGGQADWISLGKILGRLAPQAKHVEDCLPSQVEAPHLSNVGKGAGAHHPLVGWFAPSPLAHEALQHLLGLPKHLSVLAPPEHFRTPIPFVQYIDLHRRTITELLSGITSRTPNYLR